MLHSIHLRVIPYLAFVTQRPPAAVGHRAVGVETPPAGEPDAGCVSARTVMLLRGPD